MPTLPAFLLLLLLFILELLLPPLELLFALFDLFLLFIIKHHPFTNRMRKDFKIIQNILRKNGESRTLHLRVIGINVILLIDNEIQPCEREGKTHDRESFD